MNEYELVYILQPELEEDEMTTLNERISQIISDEEGSISSTELWGKRRLAYPIRNYYEGTYILHNVSMPPGAVQNVERLLRLSEDVIRFLVVRAED